MTRIYEASGAEAGTDDAGGEPDKE
eukprot:SAG11_NODE_9149_length_938_cov_1.129917_1_plen_25_part_10